MLQAAQLLFKALTLMGLAVVVSAAFMARTSR
jgi:hypothetical protein